MRRRGAERRAHRLAQLARWLETFWWCKCDYNNIATYRCYHCGARPPRRLRAELRDMTAAQNHSLSGRCSGGAA